MSISWSLQGCLSIEKGLVLPLPRLTWDLPLSPNASVSEFISPLAVLSNSALAIQNQLPHYQLLLLHIVSVPSRHPHSASPPCCPWLPFLIRRPLGLCHPLLGIAQVQPCHHQLLRSLPTVTACFLTDISCPQNNPRWSKTLAASSSPSRRAW